MAFLLQILFISFSLAIDSVSVSIAGGVNSRGAKIADALKVAFFFGAFQAIMPVLGWLIGEAMESFVASIDHWVAFLLLGIIGLKMIREALSNNGKKVKNILNNKTLLLLGIATSIDAFVVGITLGLVNIPLIISVSIIGIVTFMLCFFGYLFGSRIGTLFGKKVEILGGAVLIIIGFKILIEHLGV